MRIGTNFSRKHGATQLIAHSLLLMLLLTSGFNIAWLNGVNIFGVVSPVRVCWIALMITLLFSMRRDGIEWFAPTTLLFLWLAVNVVNLTVAPNELSTIATRAVQAVMICVLLTAMFVGHLKARDFLAFVSPHIATICGVLFLLFVLLGVFESQRAIMLRESIIGLSSNFSIFCSQWVALYLLKDLTQEQKTSSSHIMPLFTVMLTILPFVCWQVLSAGRTGLVLTILTLTAFGFVKFRWKGAVVFFLLITFFMQLIDAGLKATPYFIEYILTALPNFGLTADTSDLLNGIFYHQGGMYRKVDDLLVFTRASSSSLDVLGALDRFSSWRLTGLYETYQAINYDMIFLGLGVNQVTVLGGRFYPHVELARYLVEVGIFGLLIALALYLSPFFKRSTEPLCKFSKYYMVCFLLTTLMQPSGPLTHLNNSIVYWLAFGHLYWINRQTRSS